MKVSIVVPWFATPENPYSGIFFLEQALALKDEGMDISIINCQRVELIDILKGIYRYPFKDFLKSSTSHIHQIKVYHLKSISLPGTGFRFIGKYVQLLNHFLSEFYWLKLFRYFHKESPVTDIIHTHGADPGRSLHWLSKKTGAPYVITEHWSGFTDLELLQTKRKKIEATYSQAAEVISVSNNLAKFIKITTDRTPIIIPNGVFTNKFTPSSRTSNPFQFIVIGNLIPIKQIDMAILAFSKIANSFPDAKLSIIGKGYLQNELEFLVLKNNLENRIQFLGPLGREEISRHLSSSHVLVSSSSYETFGITLVESLSSGVPVLAIKTGGRSDIITNSKLGLLVDDDLHDLANGMTKLIENYEHFSDRGFLRDFAINNFDSKRVAQRVIEVYKKALNKK